MKLRLIKFCNVKSTNNEAIKKIKSNKINAGIVYSYSQTKGRGTMGKKWISFNGNFFITIFFELKESMPNFEEFSILNPFILKKLLSRYTNLNITIKKPNIWLSQTTLNYSFTNSIFSHLCKSKLKVSCNCFKN